MSKTPERKIAHSIGKGLAFIQDTFDVIINWGFKKIKTAKIPEKDEDENSKKTAKKVVNRTLGFFGELGDSFYSEYDKRKAKRQKK